MSSMNEKNTDAVRKDGRFSYNATLRLDRVALDDDGHAMDLEVSVEDYQGIRSFHELQEHLRSQMNSCGWS